jgi:hypothetical protein
MLHGRVVESACRSSNTLGGWRWGGKMAHFGVVDSLEKGLRAANEVVEVVAVRFATRGKQANMAVAHRFRLFEGSICCKV